MNFCLLERLQLSTALFGRFNRNINSAQWFEFLYIYRLLALESKKAKTLISSALSVNNAGL